MADFPKALPVDWSKLNPAWNSSTNPQTGVQQTGREIYWQYIVPTGTVFAVGFKDWGLGGQKIVPLGKQCNKITMWIAHIGTNNNAGLPNLATNPDTLFGQIIVRDGGNDKALIQTAPNALVAPAQNTGGQANTVFQNVAGPWSQSIAASNINAGVVETGTARCFWSYPGLAHLDSETTTTKSDYRTENVMAMTVTQLNSGGGAIARATAYCIPLEMVIDCDEILLDWRVLRPDLFSGASWATVGGILVKGEYL
ncbi:MAG: hypothetical protein L0287_13650 [Anaerolineae bacterium]|nr:hypothetical protein [Anaerolineae bacterium]